MQLALDRGELQLAAEIVEARLYECARHDPNRAEVLVMHALLDGILERRLEFDCDQLDALRVLLDRASKKNPVQPHLASLREKVTEVCAML